MKRIFSVVLLLVVSNVVWADKAGFYLGLGTQVSSFTSDNDFLDDTFGKESASGWRGEFGYIWDVGREGGLHMGIAGAYDDFGTMKGDGDVIVYYPGIGWLPGQEEFELSGEALSVYFVLEQEIASWVDFVFKVGPSVVQSDVKGANQDDSDTQAGLGLGIAFTFFPVPNFGIELASQGHAYVDDSEGSSDNDVSAVGTYSLTLQYRF